MELNNGDAGQSSAPARDAHRSKGVSRGEACGQFRGFTLAEILITLAIIGVVAAMTIPSVIVRTNQQEFKTGAKKALSVLSSAVQLVEAQEGMAPTDYNDRSYAEDQKYIEYLSKKMNIIKTDTDADGNTVFYTADGFRYHIDGPNWFYVDVNGDKGPTTNNMSKYEWASATYNDEEDLTNPEWPDVKLIDVFLITFDPDNGTSTIVPYVNECVGHEGDCGCGGPC